MIKGSKKEIAKILGEKFARLVEQDKEVNFIVENEVAEELYCEITEVYFNPIKEQSKEEVYNVLNENDIVSIASVGTEVCIQPIINEEGNTISDDSEYYFLQSDLYPYINIEAFNCANTIEIEGVKIEESKDDWEKSVVKDLMSNTKDSYEDYGDYELSLLEEIKEVIREVVCEPFMGGLITRVVLYSKIENILKKYDLI